MVDGHDMAELMRMRRLYGSKHGSHFVISSAVRRMVMMVGRGKRVKAGRWWCSM